jgi:hypothetical protein
VRQPLLRRTRAQLSWNIAYKYVDFMHAYLAQDKHSPFDCVLFDDYLLVI